jgi:hypothetical protein
MNLGQLKTHVINRVGNDAIGNVLTEFVNQVQNDMTERYPFSWRETLPVAVTTIPNQAYINISAYLQNFGDPLDAVELSSPRKLIYSKQWDINLLDPDYVKAVPTRLGVPTNYNVDSANNRMYFYPVPNGAYQVSVRYLKSAPEISNNSASLFIPSQFHHVVASGVESFAWQLDEDLQSANAANSRYEAGIQRMIEKDNSTSDNQPIMTSDQGFVDYSSPYQEF